MTLKKWSSLLRITNSCVLATHFCWQTLFFSLALAVLVAISFFVLENYQITPAFEYENYSRLLEEDPFNRSFVASVVLAVQAAFLVFRSPMQ